MKNNASNTQQTQLPNVLPFGQSYEKELPKVPSLKPPRELLIPLEALKMARTCKGKLQNTLSMI
jgi:hypothetical protein